MAGRAPHRKTTCNQLECMAVCVGSSPSQDWTPVRGSDNQSPMKQDNRDHWTLSSPVTSNICFKDHPLQPLYSSRHLFGFISRNQSWNDNSLGKNNSWAPGKICLNICWKKSTGCFAGAWVPFRFLLPTSYSSLLQSTQGNVVNFCYDRLRDNPTIAKHFVYLSHSHKSSRILKQQKGKSRSFFLAKNILVGV